MGAPLSEEVVARMKQLRAEGMSSYKVAEVLGVGRSTVLRYTRIEGHRRTTSTTRPNVVVDEWGYPIDPSLIGVEPIPFYPDDLPTLEFDDFEWTQAELDDAVEFAHQILDLQERGVQWDARFI